MQMFETYQYKSEPALAVPITVFAGKNDPMITKDKILPWSEQTSKPHTTHFYDGGHFLDPSTEAEVLTVIAKQLE
jgi:surfactin synthase thioesterase subunit